MTNPTGPIEGAGQATASGPAFLILTSAGLDDLLARPLAPATTIHLNPLIASHEGVARLRAAGAQVRVLSHPLNPDDEHDIAGAVRELEGEGSIVWLERSRPARVHVSAPAGSPPMPAPQPQEGMLRKAAGRAWRFLGDRLGGAKTLMIVPYLGYGNAATLTIKGRVLDERGFSDQGLHDSAWRNFGALYQRLESDEVRGVRVRATLDESEWETVTDAGGYFHFEVALPQPLARSGWHEVNLSLLPDSGVTARAEVLVPPESATFGVISDIDDTVLWTNVTNKLNMAMMLARSNAHTRKPFKGVAAFYRALHAGAGGNEANPVFYVSSSPWHLFGPLLQFLRLQELPVGPLMLRELGLTTLFKSAHSRAHKHEKIEAIMAAYPALKFVLIGDSGERDPEIYADVLRRHPDQVRAIYIRNVNPDPARIDALDRLTEQVSASGAQLVVAADSVAAATHAAAEGLIATDALALVRSDKKSDTAASP